MKNHPPDFQKTDRRSSEKVTDVGESYAKVTHLFGDV